MLPPSRHRILLAAMCLAAAPLGAQQPTTFQSSRSVVSVRPAYREPVLATMPDSVIKRRDYRWVGLATGALAFGLVGAAFGSMCGYDDGLPDDCTGESLVGFLAGATVGGVIGVLIGSAIPRH